jgi:hypothetical protein
MPVSVCVSCSGDDLSDGQLLEMARPIALVGTRLTAAVRKGPMLPKRPGDAKLHHSYEVRVPCRIHKRAHTYEKEHKS